MHGICCKSVTTTVVAIFSRMARDPNKGGPDKRGLTVSTFKPYPAHTAYMHVRTKH